MGHRKDQPTLPGMTRTQRTGEQLRDVALERVEQHAGEDWTERAYGVVWSVAKAKDIFQADDIHDRAWVLDLPPPPDPRAWGPVMRKAIKAKICQPTGEWKKTDRSSRHAAPTRIYRSLIRGDV